MVQQKAERKQLWKSEAEVFCSQIDAEIQLTRSPRLPAVEDE